MIAIATFLIGGAVAYASKTSSDPRDPKSYIGLTESGATSRAKQNNIDYRVVRRDNERYLVTMNMRNDRLNFEIDKGIVTEAYGGWAVAATSITQGLPDFLD